MRKLQSTVALYCVWMLVSPSTWAQQSRTSDPPKHTWFNFGQMGQWYEGSAVAPINVSNSSRLESLVRAGKLYLSLQDTVAAALENNIDIEIERYEPRLAAADLLRAKAGALIRGINTNIGSGATSAGGSTVAPSSGTTTSGTSANNNVISGNSGPPPLSLDPALTGSIQFGHFTTPQTTNFLTGTNTLISRQKIANFGLQQGFLTGTTAQLGFNNSLQDTNASRNDFNPVTSSNLDLYISQHLLQGFGLAVNNRNIRIARNNLQVSDLLFKQQVINTVANVVGLYWDLVAYNEDVAVKKQALGLAQKLYNDNKKQVEIGTLAPIEIVRAEAEVASREQDLTTSETNVLQQETIIKNAISRNGVASPTITEVSIIPTDKITMPETEAVQPIQDLTARALDARPELAQTQLQLENSRIALKGTRNALLPTIDGFVDLRNRAQAGSVNSIPTRDPITGNLVPRSPTAVDPFLLGGYGTILGQLFGRNFPDYSAGFALTIPLRNRAAQADYTTAQLNLRQSELQYQRQINSVRVDVQNALIALQQARARYQAAEKNRVLQEQTLDAEQKKYALGASTVFLVIQAQRDLATAEGTRVQALATYARARTQLNLATGRTLDANNVSIEDALKGSVSTRPSALPVLDAPGNTGSAAATPVGTPK